MSDERDWAEFKKKLFDKSTIDLNQYKPAQMQRRITNLMTRHGVKTYVEWFNKINRCRCNLVKYRKRSFGNYI